MKQASDLHSPTPNRIAMARKAAANFASHFEGLRSTYHNRRDRMLAALEAYMPQKVTWSRPDGGMFFWLTLPAISTGQPCWHALCKPSAWPLFRAGPFFADRSGRNHIRLSFSLMDGAQIDEGIARLGRLIASV